MPMPEESIWPFGGLPPATDSALMANPRTHSMRPSTLRFSASVRTMKSALILILLGIVMPISAHAQFFTKLADFDLSNGAISEASMVESEDGNFYGTTNIGGSGVSSAGGNGGTIFRFSPSSNSLTNIYSFCQTADCPTGDYPSSPLMLSHGGDLYGVPQGGGLGHGGSIFRVTKNGVFDLLYSFCLEASCPDGLNLESGLVQARDGNLYGETFEGGAYGFGTIFKTTPNGVLTTVHNFCAQSGCPDGSAPLDTMIQASNGNVYGVTRDGGAQNMGTIFQLTLSGEFTTLYNFCSQPDCLDGMLPGKLFQATDGHLYGITTQGGENATGTFFRFTAKGVFTTLYSFCATITCPSGSYPIGDIVQASDGAFYGTTLRGGDAGFGTVFRIRSNGSKYKTLYSFHNGFDGAGASGLIQATDGKLYGTTAGGGFRGAPCTPPHLDGCGTVYSMTMGLSPFVKMLTPWGTVGSTTVIYGMNVSGATAVSFNGTVASFTQTSPTQITATVPAGATTGTIQVVTPAGALSSNVVFHILP
jgi:uncharacterized repeat protein (TIGR03803 family)